MKLFSILDIMLPKNTRHVRGDSDDQINKYIVCVIYLDSILKLIVMIK